MLDRFANAVEARIGATVSVGLAANRLMTKFVAGRGNSLGVTVIDAREAVHLLTPEAVHLLP